MNNLLSGKHSIKPVPILYLDENRFIAHQVKLRLEWNGYHVETLDNEADFLYRLHHGTYQLLIIDCATPKAGAFAFLETLRNKNLHTPAILVCQQPDRDMISKSLHAGCVDLLLKELPADKFYAKLSLSIFLFLNRQNHKLQEKKVPHEPLPGAPDLTIATENPGYWEYLPVQNQVNWLSNNHTLIKTSSYSDFKEHIHPDDRAHVRTQNNICLFSQQPVEYTFRYLDSNDTDTSYHIKLKAETDKLGMVKRLSGTITKLPRQLQPDPTTQLKLSFLEQTTDAVMICDENNQIISLNPALANLTGYSEESLIKQQNSLITPPTGNFDFSAIDAFMADSFFWQGESHIHHKDGHTIPVWQSTSVLKNSNGHITQSISVFRDISQQQALIASITRQANYDHLTGLPNRILFMDRLDNAIKQTKRNKRLLAVMLLDLNKFKWINDTLGHHAGDQLLQETAFILEAIIRDSDTVARLGGDEFAIITPNLEKAADAEAIPRKIFQAFSQPVYIDQQEIYISASIGIAIYPDYSHDIESLLDHADKAMYMAKNSHGLNEYRFFTPSLQLETKHRQELIDNLRQALKNREFSLEYQPVLDINNNRVIFAEALLRWNHPKQGNISLDEFLPAAEDSGLIKEIGLWVIEQIACHFQRWTSHNIPAVQISMNQSVSQYHSPECHREWLEILSQNHIAPHRMIFEVTEALFLDSQENLSQPLKKLQQAGIQIALDKFGTGYASLTSLKKSPASIIKIDRSFIRNMVNDNTDAAMVETIILMADKLNINVIATGVENQQQFSMLRSKCRYAQGYFFSKPLAVNDFEQYVLKHNAA